ncbi:indolepyruvate ferredoxin oxidoreductase family protein [Verminephrobacter aporrectodeae subsp. tuberculatae]|uniref:indolepyruvate ferredoxin oxidoreductase family protein n=1 Tax=Verminephrobacter aporrectodeae TaxID=1110389 RepID=UPI002236F868|nr:indolepyruvate ferredoxin oxidoreductase family protein [Verminephrobacter aporrectodeae]MCW5222732.1 indolepyruvate ferredoxin oxidoreductase family protein [Verminephrobacter aporrectodeae subsp. tuberculatae]MCW5288196.1 indolepyruvate ferredoxin oxidoreductase family protein [Verminephrobacter aporrectodeae subsp. tuberculatae]
MNAPLPEQLRKAIESVSLEDKYTLDAGRAFMSGVQALVRLPLLQRRRDTLAGLNTAGFISGYRGSPLGTYDQALWAAKKHLAAQAIVFQPGVNEELGATAVWGTQQLDLYPQTKKYDGVFGIWYGKGPGVDRCADVFKHANMAGTARHGGVVAIAGDDHISKSSTAAHQSDHIFKACGTPLFFPSSVQDILDMGLHAFAMSRFAGLWSGMKTIQEVVESSASVCVDPDRVRIVLPEDFAMPPGGLHIRWPDAPLEQEARLMDYKWYAALAYVRANRLNHTVIEGPNDRFGIIASGKAYNDTRQALADLGLDDASCRRLGIRVHKVNVVWPLEASITRAFAQGLQEILVVEEKRQVIEYQLKEELYNWRADVRPNVLGKFDEPEGDATGGEWSMPNPSRNWLLRAKADLTPAIIARAIARRLKKLGVDGDANARMDARLATIEASERALAGLEAGGERMPWFCSGCPHNTSTRVPEGSRAVAGIGCHYMASWMPGRNTSTFTQMGGEGVTWVGQQPFSSERHIFANLGDGTYFHSGLLAIRQSIAAGVNITYKLLYNDAVAMTGGQPVGERPEGHSVLQIMNTLQSEGVVRLVIVTDDPHKYAGAALAKGVSVQHRDALDAIQRQLREIAGCSVIIYDQTCATEKRRRRKRATLATPQRTVLINELVCEGCGDCAVASNCLSVEPVETEFGRKRRINQSSCNKDYACINGFCPSFVTVEGGQLKKPRREARGDLSALPPLPEPVLPGVESVWGIVVGGVGGTGVITIGALLGMAAHLDGKGVVTQDAGGLAQKGGATWSHIQIAGRPDAIYSTKVDTAKADLVLGCDAIVAAHPHTLSVLQPGRSFVALNTHATPTAAVLADPDWQFPAAACGSALAAAAGADSVGGFDAEQVATQLLGDSIYTNPLLLGYAWQKGRVPLTLAALMRAMEINGVQVQNNQAAFEWGRRCAHDLAAVQALWQSAQQRIEIVKKPALSEVLGRRVEFLCGYQNATYAAEYRAFVEKVQAVEAPLGCGTRLAEAVARYLFKLMAYKDEYEVARLHTDRAFAQRIASLFDGNYQVVHHLAPPLIARKNARGELIKRPFGPWMHGALGLLAKFKGLRATAFDVFGHTEERRRERALIGEYRACVEELLARLNADNLALAVEIARVPEAIRGYGHVKARNMQAARAHGDGLMVRWRAQQAAAPERQAA